MKNDGDQGITIRLVEKQDRHIPLVRGSRWPMLGNLVAAATLGLIITSGVGHAASIVSGWGFNGSGQASPPSGLTDVVAIAAGGSHSLALTARGRVIGWGDNNVGQTNIPSGLTNAVAIASGLNHGLALTAGGRVIGWGDNRKGQTDIPSGLSNIVAIAAGDYHSLALITGGWVA